MMLIRLVERGGSVVTTPRYSIVSTKVYIENTTVKVYFTSKGIELYG